MRKTLAFAAVVAALSIVSFSSVNADTVTGDGSTYSNASGSNQGQAVSGNWYYNNVRNEGIVGIVGTYARSGNGSAYFETVNGPGGASSKADFEYLSGGVDVGGNYYSSTSFGNLGDLSALTYEWYRDSSSTNSAAQHPALRILVDADGDLGTTSDRGGLVFEAVYNGSATATTDTWVSEDIFAYNGGSGANLWTFGAGMAFAEEGYGITLSDWQGGLNTVSANSAVIGFSMGVGSGWGPFQGAVDNFSFAFAGGPSGTFNFEAIPEPASLSLLSIAAFGLVVRRNRRA